MSMIIKIKKCLKILEAFFIHSIYFSDNYIQSKSIIRPSTNTKSAPNSLLPFESLNIDSREGPIQGLMKDYESH